MADLFRACDEAYGRLDVLVNSAGAVGAMADLAAMDMAAWDHTIAVNLRGVVLCVKGAMALLRRQGGAIVNIGSRGGLHGGRAGASDYVASKFAVTGLTESLAQELGPLGIRVNDVCPGVVDTEMSRRSLEAMGRDLGMAAADVRRTMFTETAALGRLVEAEGSGGDGALPGQRRRQRDNRRSPEGRQRAPINSQVFDPADNSTGLPCGVFR